MSDYNAIRAGFEPLRIIDFGSIGGGFTDVGIPAQHPIRAIKVVNDTDSAMELSYDGGLTVHEYIPAKSGYTWDFATNRMDPAGAFLLPRFTVFSVRYFSAPATLGDFAITVMYGATN